MKDRARVPLILGPGEGREYDLGPVISVFKADGAVTNRTYSVSEWWVDPHTEGAYPHQHEEDDLFFVIEGVMSFFVKDSWFDAPRGSFILVPGGTLHGFQNRSELKAAVLNFSIQQKEIV